LRRNLLEKAFAYLRGSIGIEYKISKLSGKVSFFDAENTTVTGDFGTR
jgi:hypothetical protein